MTRPQFTRRAHQVAPGGELTPAQFHAIAELTIRRDATRVAARLILVDGVHPAQAAEQAGISRESAYNAAARIRRAHKLVADAYRPDSR